MLLGCLSPTKPAVTQTASGDFIKALITISANASQNEQSCIGPNDLTRQLVSDTCINILIKDMLQGGNALTVGVGIIIEVIRKNNSDYDPDIGTGVDSIPTSRDPIYLGTLLKIFASHVPDFMRLVLTQNEIVTNADGTKTEKKRELPVAFGGTIEPLGFDRFKTCELMAELLHCSNMGLLNEKGGERYVKDRDRERDRLKAERQQEFLSINAGTDINVGNEEVVVEKTHLHVQNGGAEFSDDGMNEEEFEDVSISGVMEEERGGQSGGAHAAEDTKEKFVDDEDVFVDEPLSPPMPATYMPKDTAEKELPPAPMPAAIPADEIPPLHEPPKEVAKLEESETNISQPPQAPTEETPEAAMVDDVDTKMEESPQPPPKDNQEEGVKKEGTEQTSEEQTKQESDDVPRAPSPPSGEGDDETLRNDGRSLVEDLKAASSSSSSASCVMHEKMNKSEHSHLEEENLMDMGSSPDTTIAEGDVSTRSLGSIGSSFTEYQTMIEPDLDGNPVVGDYLKIQFVEHSVVPTILVR